MLAKAWYRARHFVGTTVFIGDFVLEEKGNVLDGSFCLQRFGVNCSERGYIDSSVYFQVFFIKKMKKIKFCILLGCFSTCIL
ncbi:MAG: hypothetical protein CMF61_02255 [Magnetococcales bacterium]|nr:hypothetical protein [Magnetococcales bacterium]|tara:strand:+ start:506 stop:751 length:246 start_codon:yes stop_codon:yes gene_type:complete